VYYSVSCVLLSDSCVLLGRQLCITRSVVFYSTSCVLILSQLCFTRSVVYYPVICVLLGQLCNTRSVVYYSVSCVFLVSCVLLGQLMCTPTLSVVWLLGQLCIFGQLYITRSVNVYSDSVSRVLLRHAVVSVTLG